jgi:hypothetical protein
MVFGKKAWVLAALCAVLSSGVQAQDAAFGLGASLNEEGVQVGSDLGRGALNWERERSGEWSLGVVRTQWVETRLPLFPKNLVTGNLRPRQSFATTLVATKRLGTLDIAPERWWGVSGIGVEAEGTLSVHDGYQDHVEATAGVMLRSPGLDWDGVGRFGLGWANGFSYAFSAPKFERGASGVRGLDSERFQYYMAFEATFSPEGAPNMELFTRLHHRSGIYGVISPDNTGSNMLGGGVRFRF